MRTRHEALDVVDESPGRGPEPTLDEAFAADGVDPVAIRWMLERTPTERLQAAQDLIDLAWVLREIAEGSGHYAASEASPPGARRRGDPKGGD